MEENTKWDQDQIIKILWAWDNLKYCESKKVGLYSQTLGRKNAHEKVNGWMVQREKYQHEKVNGWM